MLSVLLVAAVLETGTGCATSKKMDVMDLTFLQDGHTTREDVMAHLGAPSDKFQGERILTYRVGKKAQRGYEFPEREHVVRSGGSWHSVKYSLVLVFDESGVLRKHNMVKVN